MSDKKNFFMRHKILSVILVIVVISLFSNLGKNKKEEVSKLDESPKTQQSNTNKDTENKEEKSEYNLGEVISTEDYDIIVENERNVEGYGKTYQVFDVTITSKKDNKSFLGNIQGVTEENEVIDSDVVISDEDLGDMITTAWSKKLNSGQKAKGYLAFDRDVVEIELRSNYFINDVIKIKVK